MKYTDSHCHIDFKEFDCDRASVLAQCTANDIHRLIVPSIYPNNWQTVLDLSSKPPADAPDIFPCLGIHPWFLNELTEDNLNSLEIKINDNFSKIIGIGECGIDLPIADKYNNLEKQISFFEYQLDLAKQYNLPVIVHHRRTHHLTVPLLKKVSLPRCGIIHAFSGSYQEAKQYIDIGFKLGIGGTITYPRAKKTINTVKRLPLDSLVLETDAPSMPLNGYQGEINSPLKILEVFKHLSELREETPEKIADSIENNINQIFFTI